MTFSFVVPVTHRIFLSQTLRSIAVQKGELEVILVDDSGQGYAREYLPEKLRSQAVVIENKANRGRKDPTYPKLRNPLSRKCSAAIRPHPSSLATTLGTSS